MSLAQGNNTPTRPRIEPGSPDPESDALTTRPVRPPIFSVYGFQKHTFLKVREENCIFNHLVSLKGWLKQVKESFLVQTTARTMMA